MASSDSPTQHTAGGRKRPGSPRRDGDASAKRPKAQPKKGLLSSASGRTNSPRNRGDEEAVRLRIGDTLLLPVSSPVFHPVRRAQEEIRKLEDQCVSDQIVIQKSYDQMKQPCFDRRTRILRKIPYFWSNVVARVIDPDFSGVAAFIALRNSNSASSSSPFGAAANGTPGPSAATAISTGKGHLHQDEQPMLRGGGGSSSSSSGLARLSQGSDPSSSAEPGSSAINASTASNGHEAVTGSAGFAAGGERGRNRNAGAGSEGGFFSFFSNMFFRRPGSLSAPAGGAPTTEANGGLHGGPQSRTPSVTGDGRDSDPTLVTVARSTSNKVLVSQTKKHGSSSKGGSSLSIVPSSSGNFCKGTLFLSGLVDVQLADNLDAFGSHRFAFAFSELFGCIDVRIVKSVNSGTHAVTVDCNQGHVKRLYQEVFEPGVGGMSSKGGKNSSAKGAGGAAGAPVLRSGAADHDASSNANTNGLGAGTRTNAALASVVGVAQTAATSDGSSSALSSQSRDGGNQVFASPDALLVADGANANSLAANGKTSAQFGSTTSSCGNSNGSPESGGSKGAGNGVQEVDRVFFAWLFSERYEAYDFGTAFRRIVWQNPYAFVEDLLAA
ncbi:unnamed protein product [Amoebophrya sp. A25]|nr:unnamed protein product [Amoebophrya sp. A25]|eukprot:GSA25T00018667001.1